PVFWPPHPGFWRVDAQAAPGPRLNRRPRLAGQIKPRHGAGRKTRCAVVAGRPCRPCVTSAFAAGLPRSTTVHRPRIAKLLIAALVAVGLTALPAPARA